MAQELIRYDAMCRAIAEAYEVDEVKDLRDKALAIETYARQARNTEAERQACEIRLRAERKWGQLYKAADKAKGGNPSLAGRGSEPTLSDMGVSPNQSSRWQGLGEVDDETFERAVTQPGASTNGILAEAKPKQQHPVDLVSEEALWLWGTLKDFNLNTVPSRICDTMLPHMRNSLRDWLPAVIEYLQGIDP